MRRELAAAMLISLYWIIAGFFVAYSAWEMGYAVGSQYFSPTMIALPNPYLSGLILAVIGIIFTFVVARTLLPSRATQRRRLRRLLDDAGIEDVDLIRRKLSVITDEYGGDLDRIASLETLLSEQKRKNRA